MSDDTPDVRPEDALQVAQRALARCSEFEGRLTEAERLLADLEEDLTAVRLRTSAFDEDRPYRDLSRDDKIGIVREELFQQAVDGRGRTMDYSDIRNAVFDGKPSPSHCYDLMEWAAEARGFGHKIPARGNEHLYVDPDEAKRSYAFYSAKKPVSEGGV